MSDRKTAGWNLVRPQVDPAIPHTTFPTSGEVWLFREEWEKPQLWAVNDMPPWMNVADLYWKPASDFPTSTLQSQSANSVEVQRRLNNEAKTTGGDDAA